MNEAKKWYTSVTLWFNSVGGGLLIFLVEYLPTFVEDLPMLKDYLPANLYRYAFVAIMVGNAIIRARTKTAVKL